MNLYDILIIFKISSPMTDIGIMDMQEQFIRHYLNLFFVSYCFQNINFDFFCKTNMMEVKWSIDRFFSKVYNYYGENKS
jgi:hypothetical protein